MESDRIADIVIVTAFLAIIIGKLVGWITWPWVWITAIIWVPLLIGAVLAVGFLLLIGIEILVDKIKEN